MIRMQLLRIGLVVGVGLAAPLQPPGRAQGNCTPAAVMSPGSATVDPTSLSADGRYMVFASDASTLVPNDTNNTVDVFVFDRLNCSVERVSTNSAEEQANSASFSGSISHDGRFVAFQSFATNLGPSPKALGTRDVFVRDRQNGVTLHASPALGGGWNNGDARLGSISGDGRFVAFWSSASDLVGADTNQQWDAFVRDLLAGTTTRASVASGGIESLAMEGFVQTQPLVLSSDGRYVGFASLRDDLVAGDTNGTFDVFRHDRQTGTTIRVSTATGGTQALGNSFEAEMSRDGRYVAFSSNAANLAGSDPDTFGDVFVHDVDSNLTTHVSVDSRGGQISDGGSFGPSLSGDGRYVAFESSAVLAPGGSNFAIQIYVRDLMTGTTRLASVSEAGEPGNEDSRKPDLSDNGAFVSFFSESTTLLPGASPPTVFVTEWSSVPGPPLVNLLQNGLFNNGQDWWTTFALPEPDDLVWNITGGEFQFYRETGSAQGVVFQSTGVQLLPFAPITASFELRNASNVRKRISVLIHDRDFSDLSVCTFWLDPSAPVRAYSMRTHTTRRWSNATLSFYAATADGLGFYGLDAVSLVYDPSLPDTGTECVDPTALIGVGVPGPNLLVNGDFSAGLAPWGTFGQIVSQVSSVGVFEFYRPPGTPAGVVFQDTGQPITDNTRLTASFSLGNSSTVRKRVTVLVHASDFSDLSACTFWLPPQLPLTPYSMRLFATKAWSRAMVSVYAATIGTEQWIRLDDVTLQRTPGAATPGTSCIEPDLNPRPAARTSSLAGMSAVSRPPDVERRRITVEGSASTGAGGQSRAPRFTLHVWLPPHEETLDLEISADGETWTMVARFERSSDWTLVELDAPPAVQVRLRPAR